MEQRFPRRQVLGPVWFCNVIVCAGLLAPTIMQRERVSGLRSCLSSVSWRPLLMLALLAAFELLLTHNLDEPHCGTEGDAGAASVLEPSVPLVGLHSMTNPAGTVAGRCTHGGARYLLAFTPLLLYLTPGLVSATTRLYITVKKKSAEPRGSDQPEPPALTSLALAFAFQLLLFLGVLLIGLQLDGLMDASWWLVLLPLWLLFAVVGCTLRQTYASIGAASSRPSEERAARRVGIVCVGIVSAILAWCMLLLSLRLGGQADFSAAMILMPAFGIVGLLLCCGCCLACGARLAAAMRPEDGYSVQRDEEVR